MNGEQNPGQTVRGFPVFLSSVGYASAYLFARMPGYTVLNPSPRIPDVISLIVKNLIVNP